MKPCSRIPKPSGNLLQDVGFGSNNTIGTIRGTVKKLGANYRNAIVVLYSKDNFKPIAMRKPNENGDYKIIGLNNSVKCFVSAFDLKLQYNAVIQDNVVPK